LRRVRRLADRTTPLGRQPVSSAPRSGGERRGVSGGELLPTVLMQEFPP